VTERSGINFTLDAAELRNVSSNFCNASQTNATSAEVAEFGAITLRATGAANEVRLPSLTCGLIAI
jgi:hypothetical protein